MEHLIASPCCIPKMTLVEIMEAYAKLGFEKFEVFTSWVESAFDIDRSPQAYLDAGSEFGMRFVSLHLPPVDAADDGSVERAVAGVRFAQAIGVSVVLYKGKTREDYVRFAGPVLDEAAALGVTAVVQNHAGTAISTLDDVRAVRAGVNDERLKTLLEVGHFHAVGVGWREAAEELGDSIALVHIKDQVGAQSVPFGTGEIDLPALFAYLRGAGYDGDYVVEMEVKDPQNTLQYLADAIDYVKRHCT